MMLNVMIVDDEKTIRNGLAKYVKWEEMGCEVKSVAASGEDALKCLGNTDIDIILTDIVMDGISGLELIDKVMREYPDIKTIILSGYDEFDYVKKAIDLGAYAYLTKPVNLEELSECIEKMRKKILEERELNVIKNERDLFKEECFLNKIVHGAYESRREIFAALGQMGIEAEETDTRFIRVHLDKENIGGDEKIGLISEIHAGILTGRGFCFDSGIKEITVVIPGAEYKKYVNAVSELIDRRVGKDSYYISVSQNVTSFEQWQKAFINAGKTLEYRLIKKGQNILYFDELNEYLKGMELLTDASEQKIYELLTEKMVKELHKYTAELMEKCGNKFTWDMCIEIILTINKFISENIGAGSDFQQVTLSVIRSILYKVSENAVIDELKDYINQAVEIINNNENMQEHTLVSKMKKYITENYSEHITLESISKAVYAHPVYLSKLFREETGMNFIDYLTKVRIDKAKELLRNSSYKIYDISYMVGYESSKHFSTVFKELTGYTPKEYKRVSDV
ncbi:MAG: response regulator [Clostridia bacterium]|nr:response regulator [Clostridia bacterium]